MTTPATASSLREALSPEVLTRARRRLLTAHPDPTSPNNLTPVSLTDEQLRGLAAHDWAPPRIAALDTNTLATADPITRALLAESVCETLERRLTAERPHGTYDDTHTGHDAFSRGVVDDYDHGNHHLARATIRVAALVLAAPTAQRLADAIDTVAAAAINTGARVTDLTTQYIDEEKALAIVGIDPWATRPSDDPTGKADRILCVGCDGARVHVKAGRVLVDAPGSLPATSVPKNSVARIVLSGNVGLSSGARSWAMRSGVDVVCLSRRGSYQGTLIGANRGANASRLLAQVAIVGDRERRVRLAAGLNGAKIRGHIHVLTRIARRDETVNVADTTDRTHARVASLARGRSHPRRNHGRRGRVLQRLLRRARRVRARRRHLRRAQPTPTPRPAQRRPVLRVRHPSVRMRRGAPRRRARTVPRCRARAHR